MWIVALALRRPYTFVVTSLLIALLGILAASRMPIDIFPQINIPVVSVIWLFKGLAPQDMANRIVTVTERAMTTATSDIEHIESNSINGMGVIRVFLRQDSDLGANIALLAAEIQTSMKALPPGITPPTITALSATDVPVMQIGVGSKTLGEAELNDYGANFIRPRLATAGGCSIPLPYGGRLRQVMVDIDPGQLYSRGLSANDVANAINLQNLIIPAGVAKIGTKEYPVAMNSSPKDLAELDIVPIKQVNNAMVYVKDVGHAHDGYAVQTNVVNQDGRRSTLLNVLRAGGASTLTVVDNIKKTLPTLLQTLPKELDVRILTDQSIFVKAAVQQVVVEAVVAATLTGLIMLLLLGSWRSTLIVAISIPLSILASIICLFLSGQTLNTMTLGGLALAVGMLVDDATVEVENIHRNLDSGKAIVQAILDGAEQIAIPALVSTLSICIVFVPVTLLTEPSRSLFVPLAMAVVFAMLASYGLSRTLVPVMCQYLLSDNHTEAAPRKSLLYIMHKFIDTRFDLGRDIYLGLLRSCFKHSRIAVSAFLVFYIFCAALIPFVGQDFFPTVDSGELRLHVIAPKGDRIEETEKCFAEVEKHIRSVIPAEEIKVITQNIGLPTGGLNLAYGDNITFSNFDGEILVSLNAEHRGSVFDYQKRIRQTLHSLMPEVSFFFQPADINSRILNAGLPAPIDVQISGKDSKAAYAIAQELMQRIRNVPGAVDVTLLQVPDQPQLDINIDRAKAIELNLTQRDIANSVLVSLSSSFQTAPNFWVNPKNGVSYNLAVQVPTYQINHLQDIFRLPITTNTSGKSQMLKNLATFDRSPTPAIVSHYQIMPVFDVLVNLQDRDLGSLRDETNKIVDQERTKLPRGIFITVRGQATSMTEAFSGLLQGLSFALVLIYMLLVVNFQSWSEPVLILMASPGALSGVILILFLTQTTFSVPALMGAIMSIGVATANSILVVSFAEEKLKEGWTPFKASIEAGKTRFRPVIMTATAMIIGMLPMATGLGEGGSANAPLGRAVAGGLMVATFSTLFFVPLVFALYRQRANRKKESA